MSYLVSSYNTDSGWKVGEYLSHAVSEAQAAEEAVKILGIEGLTQFRHVVTDIGEQAVTAAPEETDAVPEETDAVPEETDAVPAADPEVAVAPVVDEIERVAEQLKAELEPSALAKLLSKLNSALGG